MEKKFYKKVLLPIEVSDGDFCWDGNRICGHFDNTGGHAMCSYGLTIPKRDKHGHYPKPELCRGLLEAGNGVIITSEDVVNLTDFIHRRLRESSPPSLINGVPSQGRLELLVCQWIRDKKGINFFKGE